jgi:hypothetical protein
MEGPPGGTNQVACTLSFVILQSGLLTNRPVARITGSKHDSESRGDRDDSSSSVEFLAATLTAVVHCGQGIFI